MKTFPGGPRWKIDPEKPSPVVPGEFSPVFLFPGEKHSWLTEIPHLGEFRVNITHPGKFRVIITHPGEIYMRVITGYENFNLTISALT